MEIAQTILVPAYQYPTNPGGTSAYWNQYASGYPTCNMLIANAMNGPGGSVNSDYLTAIANAQMVGLKVIGYVDTNYANMNDHPPSVVEADIDRWYTLYEDIDGIMFDRVSATTGDYTYYQTLYNYIKAKSTTRNFVALNPGATPDETYMKISDTISIMEAAYAKYQSSSPYQNWMKLHAPSKLWLLVHTIPDIPSMQAIVTQAKAANIGRLYLTDQTYPDPGSYHAPPSTSFWNAELTAGRHPLI
jgi:hypothetical protein